MATRSNGTARADEIGYSSSGDSSGAVCARTFALCSIECVTAVSSRAEDEVRLRLLLRLDHPVELRRRLARRGRNP